MKKILFLLLIVLCSCQRVQIEQNYGTTYKYHYYVYNGGRYIDGGVIDSDKELMVGYNGLEQLIVSKEDVRKGALGNTYYVTNATIVLREIK